MTYGFDPSDFSLDLLAGFPHSFPQIGAERTGSVWMMVDVITPVQSAKALPKLCTRPNLTPAGGAQRTAERLAPKWLNSSPAEQSRRLSFLPLRPCGPASDDKRSVPPLKPREPRRKVMIKARMRIGAAWQDVCILNVSSRGLLCQAGSPPARGTYVEICRGRHLIVARVVWNEGRRSGLRTQDCLPIDDVVSEPDGSGARVAHAAQVNSFVERRASPRNTGERHADSRIASRLIEFTAVAVFGVSAAYGAATLLQAALAPVTSAADALDGDREYAGLD